MSKPFKCPKCDGSVVMVEYGLLDKNHYDGISEYVCAKGCGWRIGRWCEQELQADEIEPRWCKGKRHPRIFKL